MARAAALSINESTTKVVRRASRSPESHFPIRGLPLPDRATRHDVAVPSTCSSIQVEKTWVIDDVQYNNPLQPFGNAELGLPEVTNPQFGTEYTQNSAGKEFEAGNRVNISENVTNLPDGCTNVSSGHLGEQTLAGGKNVFLITNTVTCTRITLVKVVEGNALPGAWTLKDKGRSWAQMFQVPREPQP